MKNTVPPIKARMHFLLVDTRTYRRRVAVIFPPALFLVFTLVLFGPVELYRQNQGFLSFTMDDVLLVFIMAFILGLALLCGLLPLLRGRLFDAAASGVFGLALACYIQSAFLNIDYGTMDGTTIPWHRYRLHMAVNLLVWAVLLLLPLVLRFFSARWWKKVLVFVSLFVTAVQLVALVSILPSAKWAANEPYYAINSDKKYELAANDNVVVFVLDTFSADVMDEVINEFPEVSAAFSDFTLFRNHSTNYCSTFPSMTKLLTGRDMDFSRDYREYFDEAWEDDNTAAFYDTLRENGYRSFLFSEPTLLANSAGQLATYYDNIVENRRDINRGALLNDMLQLSAFRYAPHGLKPTFWQPDGAFADVLPTASGYSDNYTFYDELLETGLSTQSEANHFVVYHIEGPHTPFFMNADIEEDFGATYPQKARGSLRIVEEYLRQMKDLGLYDRAAVVITSDHGLASIPYHTPSALMMVKRPGETNGQMQITEAPTAEEDFRATVLDLAGIDYAGFGQSVFDWDEDTTRERIAYRLASNTTFTAIGYGKNLVLEYRFKAHIDEVDPYAPTQIIDGYTSPY